jgi:4-amino-4-deoxy-L-arabinose transferase-like glycosyltransferase
VLHLGAVAAILRAQDKRFLSWTAASAACLVLAGLATPVSLAFFPFMLLWLLAFSNFSRRERLIHTGTALLVVSLGLLPWTYYNYQRTGQIALIDARAKEHIPYFIESETSRADRRSAYQDRISTILSNPDKFAVRTAKEFIHFWTFVPDRVVTKDPAYREKAHQADSRMQVEHSLTSPLLDYVSILTYGPVLVLALAGLILSRARWRTLSLILFMLLSQAIGYSFFFTQVRYRLPVEFCLMILAATALNYVWLKYRGNSQPA